MDTSKGPLEYDVTLKKYLWNDHVIVHIKFVGVVKSQLSKGPAYKNS